MLSNDATFNEHIEHVCKKTRQNMGCILITFKCRNNEFMRKIFNSLVQPHINYCSQLWMPNQTQQMEKIEKLAKSFTGKIPWLREESYWSRLNILRMNSQERRMERYRIVYTWKILEGLVPNCGVEEIGSTEERQGRRCKIPAGNSARRLQSFQVGGPKAFNSLPEYLRNTSKCSVEEFKEKLDRFLCKVPDEPKIGVLIPAGSHIVTAQPSNSIASQIARMRKEAWRT